MTGNTWSLDYSSERKREREARHPGSVVSCDYHCGEHLCGILFGDTIKHYIGGIILGL